MNIAKPTVAGAIASITKGIKQLEAVIVAAAKAIAENDRVIGDAIEARDAAVDERNRAEHIKAKLEELVA